MKLSEELKAAGLSKTELAELLNVSRKTVSRMGEDISDEVLKIIQEYVPKVGERVKEPSDYTDDEIAALCKRRGGLEAETRPPKEGETSPSWGRETDFEISQSIGIQVWEFNEMIARYVRSLLLKNAVGVKVDLRRIIKDEVASFDEAARGKL